jgi:hypothetical protein
MPIVELERGQAAILQQSHEFIAVLEDHVAAREARA